MTIYAVGQLGDSAPQWIFIGQQVILLHDRDTLTVLPRECPDRDKIPTNKLTERVCRFVLAFLLSKSRQDTLILLRSSETYII